MGYRSYGGLIDISVDEDTVIEAITQNYNASELIEKLELDAREVAEWAVSQYEPAQFLERFIAPEDLASYVESSELFPAAKSDDEVIAGLRSRYSALELAQRLGLMFKCEYAPPSTPEVIGYPLAPPAV
jgi:hypothetical protein